MKRETRIDKSNGVARRVDTISDKPHGADIARRAYELWQARGCPEGDALRDWLEAERALTGGRDVGTAAKGGRQ